MLLLLDYIRALPKKIVNLDSLRILDLRNNSFNEIPKEIVGLKNLKDFELHNCESQEEVKVADIRWPFPILTNKIDYISQIVLFTDILKKPTLKSYSIALNKNNYKDSFGKIKKEINNDTLIKKISAWIYINHELDSIYPPPPTTIRIGVSFGSSFTTITGNASTFIDKSFMPICFAEDVLYKKFILKTGFQNVIKQQAHVKEIFSISDTIWPKSSTVIIEKGFNINLGYAIIENRHLKISPFIGFNSIQIGLLHKKNEMKFKTPLMAGIDFDVKIRPANWKHGFRFCRIKFAYTQLRNDFNDKRFDGGLLNIGLELGVSRDVN